MDFINMEIIKNWLYYQFEKLDASYALSYLLLSIFAFSNPFVCAFVFKYGKLALAGATCVHIYLLSLLMNTKEFIISPEQIKLILGIAIFILLGYETRLHFKDSVFNPYLKQDNLTPTRTRILKVIDISNLIVIVLEVLVVLSGNVFKLLMLPIFIRIWVFVHLYFFIMIRYMIRKGTQTKIEHVEVSRGLIYSSLVGVFLSGFNISMSNGILLDFLKGIEVAHDSNHKYYSSYYLYICVLSQRICWLTFEVYTPLQQAIQNKILKMRKSGEKSADHSGENTQDEKVVSEV